MKIRILIFTFFIIFFWNCNNKTIEDGCDYVVNIDPKNASKIEKLSNVYEILNYVPLETNDSSFIGNISKLICHHGQFFIFDELSNSIFCFSNEGKFNYKIHAEGKGPGEYLHITDFCCFKEELFILDVSLGKVLIFKNGKHVYDINKKILATNFERIPDGFVFYSGFLNNSILKKHFSNKNAIITNSDLNPQDAFLRFPENLVPNAIMRYPKNMQNVNGNILLWQPFDYNIYQIDNKNIRVKYRFKFENHPDDMGSKIINLAIKKHLNPSDLLKKIEELGYCDIIDLIDSESYIHIIYKYRNSYHFTYFNKYSQKVYDYSKESSETDFPVPLVNDVDGILYYPLMATSNDTIYSYANAYEYSEKAQNVNLFDKNLMNINSNPVIVTLKIKIQ